MKILYLAHRIPYPPNKGDKIRSFNEIKYLSQKHEIHLACLADDPKDLKYEGELTKYCKTVRIVPVNPQLAKLKSIFYLLTKQPLTIPYFYSRKLQQTIDHLLSANDFDVIFCFSSPMAEYVFESRVLSPQSIVHRRRAKDNRLATISHHPSTINHQPWINKPTTISEQPLTNNHRPSTKLIMDFVDVDSDKWAQYAEYTSFPKSWIYRLEATRLAAYERTVAEVFDHCIFVTGAEEKIFKGKNPHIQNVSVVSNGVDLDYFSPSYLHQKSTIDQGPSTKGRDASTIDQDPSTTDHGLSTKDHRPRTIDHRPVIVFTGAMDYYANIDGVVWFTKEVLPLIKREIPDAQFFIIGSNPTKEVIELSGNNGVTVTGYVPDTREYLRRATVAVVPLRIARGIQNKILEAMAMGIPVVATPQAFEGINAAPHKDLLVEDGPGDFAHAVITLLRNQTLRNELRSNARCKIEANYSWPRNVAKLNELLPTTSQPPESETGNSH